MATVLTPAAIRRNLAQIDDQANEPPLASSTSHALSARSARRPVGAGVESRGRLAARASRDPHANWDFGVGYLAKIAAGLPVAWIGKDTLFRWPVAGLLRRMGGMPVNRREPTGLVKQLARALAEREWLWIALAPEGTRSAPTT